MKTHTAWLLTSQSSPGFSPWEIRSLPSCTPKAAEDIQVFRVPEKAKALPAPALAKPMEAKLKVVFAENTWSSDPTASTAHLVVMSQVNEETGFCSLMEVPNKHTTDLACLVPISDVWSFLLQEQRLTSETEGLGSGSKPSESDFIHGVVTHHRWRTAYSPWVSLLPDAKVSKAGRVLVLRKLTVWRQRQISKQLPRGKFGIKKMP